MMCRHSLSVTCCWHILLTKSSVPHFTPSPQFAPCYPTGLIYVQCGGYTLNPRSLQSPFVIADRHITLQTAFLGAFTHQFPATIIHYSWPWNQKPNIHFMQPPFVVLHLTYAKFQVFLKTCYCTQFQDLRFSSVSIAPASQICGL